MRKIISVFMLLVVSVLLLTACGEGKKLTIATGNEGGTYYEYGSKLAEGLADQYEGEIRVLDTAGSKANIDLINGKVADVALAQADLVDEALNESGEEKENNFHILGTCYDESLILAVTKDSGISAPEQMKGATIAVGEEDSATAIWAEAIRKGSLLKKDDVTFVNMTMEEAMEAVADGDVDGCYFLSLYTNPTIIDFVNKNDMVVLGFSKQALDFAVDDYEYINAQAIPAGTYKNQEEDIQTLSVPALLIASNNLNKNIEELIVQTVQNDESFASFTPWEAEDEGDTVKKTPVLKLDMYMTLALAVVCLFLGMFLRKKVAFLVKFCIPAPVIGGMIFAIVTCVLYSFHMLEISFDESFKDICMMMFFTSVGFQANLKTLKKGGKTLLILVILVAVLAVLQNVVAIGLALVIGQTPLMGMTTGSVPMLGGHGIGGAFGPIMEGLGLEGATTICIAAATFGLVMGSLMGGPLAERLIEKRDLVKTAIPLEVTASGEEKTLKNKVISYAGAAYQLAIAMGLGALVMLGLNALKMTFPMYIGGMIVAAVMRNVSEKTGKFPTPMKEMEDIGDISLSLFLGIAMITLKLWQLADLALPLIILLVGQVVLMFLYARFVAFNFLGKDYDAAVITSGICGFGMGATPNAMANMQAVTAKYVPSAKAFLIVPIIGSMFNDTYNSGLITLILNLIK